MMTCLARTRIEFLKEQSFIICPGQAQQLHLDFVRVFLSKNRSYNFSRYNVVIFGVVRVQFKAITHCINQVAPVLHNFFFFGIILIICIDAMLYEM